VSLTFLGEGSHKATILTDLSPDPNGIQEAEKNVTKTDRLTIKLEPGGGMVAHIQSPKK